MNYSKISFFGLGLIGGSIAKAIKTHYPDAEVYARTRSDETIRLAHSDGIISNSENMSVEELADSDLIFLCGPVGINDDYLRELAPIVKSDTILTDVGSVKGNIHKVADSLGLSQQFIGGHPMTGSEKIGFEYSDPGLLVNTYYILTAEDEVAREKLPALREFVGKLGPIMLTLSPSLHDFATGAISHLPHVAAAALVNLVSDNETDDDLLKTIAAGGFRDITRISSSSPQMWEHICKANRDEVLKLISLYKESIDKFESTISNEDYDGLRELFSDAKEYRDSLSVRKRGAISQTHDFYCDLFDEAGQIAAVATILAASGLSIKNIGIVHNREFSEGVLHVEMYDEESLSKSLELLGKHGYKTYEKK